jgi:hypothetical protein
MTPSDRANLEVLLASYRTAKGIGIETATNEIVKWVDGLVEQEADSMAEQLMAEAL